MNERRKSHPQKPLALIALVTVVCMFAASSQAVAQQFKPGDRVECDVTANGNYLKGTVLPYLEKDEPVFKGKYYLTRVLIDKQKGLYPEGALCHTERIRLLKEDTENKKGPKYKPGDRVECDLTANGDFLKGTVLPYLEKDEPVFKGKYYLTRVLIDKYIGLYPEGVLSQTERTRLLTGDTEKPPNDQTPEAKDENKKTEDKIGPKYKPGDRVECDAANIGNWLKGTVLPYLGQDEPDLETDKTGKYFYIHRVRLDRDASIMPAGGMCFTDRTRLLTGAAAKPPPVDKSIGKVSVDENNTLSADRPILDCPVKQPKVKNGALPDAELLKKIIRCIKGEKRAEKGMDGAVTVDVTALQFGASRTWNPLLDSGDGRAQTVVYPVKVTYTVKTFYRSRTVVNTDWIRIINFYVDPFGEWQGGSEVPVKSPQSEDIPRTQ